MRNILLSLISILIFTEAFSQDECPCCSKYHRQFDFWVGEWIVYDTSGNVVGENSIQKLEQGCIVSEHWRGAKGLTGRSYNYYNLADSTWNQLWIDSNGSNLILKGHAEKGKMILRSELMKGRQVDWYYNQIIWTANQDGSVTQLWQMLDQEDNVLSTAFKGIYRRKE
jgi:hypothetical protein